MATLVNQNGHDVTGTLANAKVNEACESYYATDAGLMVHDGVDQGKFVPQVARAVYDFAVDGGAIGAIDLDVDLPDNAIIKRAYYDVVTTFTSATDAATVALHAESADDILAAVAISAGGNALDAGLHEGIEDGTMANAVKTSAVRALTLTIAVEAVTAGKLVLFVEYVIGG